MDEHGVVADPRALSSPTVAALVTALAKAQGTFGKVVKEKEARVRSEKGNYTYNYADLASFLEAIRPHLSAQELAITQQVEGPAREEQLVTTLWHSSGEWMRSRFPCPFNDTWQRVGSGLTYARRYAIQALVGIASAEDDADDGASAPPPASSSMKRNAPPPEGPANVEEPPDDESGPDDEISAMARRRFFAECGKRAQALGDPSIGKAEVGKSVLATMGYESTTDLKNRDMATAIERVRTWQPPIEESTDAD